MPKLTNKTSVIRLVLKVFKPTRKLIFFYLNFFVYCTVGTDQIYVPNLIIEIVKYTGNDYNFLFAYHLRNYAAVRVPRFFLAF